MKVSSRMHSVKNSLEKMTKEFDKISPSLQAGKKAMEQLSKELDKHHHNINHNHKHEIKTAKSDH